MKERGTCAVFIVCEKFETSDSGDVVIILSGL